MNTAVPVLELSGLSKTYGGRKGGVRAVQDVSLTIGAGEVYGFLGPNGAGKSTTIRMLLGLITPTAGRASLWGKDVLKTREGLHRVGSLVDGGTFYPFLSGRKNLQVLSRTHGRAPAARARPASRRPPRAAPTRSAPASPRVRSAPRGTPTSTA